MDYENLAKEFLKNLHLLQRAGHQRFFQEGIQGEAIVLHHIGKHDEVIPGQISDAMGVSSARVAAVLNSLESKGLVTREIDVGDRRRIIVKLTPKGAERAEEQHKKNLETMSGVLSELGERDAKEYVRITGKLADILSNFRN